MSNSIHQNTENTTGKFQSCTMQWAGQLRAEQQRAAVATGGEAGEELHQYICVFIFFLQSFFLNEKQIDLQHSFHR